MEQTEDTLKKTTLMLKATQRSERLLTNEANKLIATLKDSILDGDTLHKNLIDYQKEEEHRKANAREFQQTSSILLDGSVQTLNELSTKVIEHLTLIKSSANSSKQNDQK